MEANKYREPWVIDYKKYPGYSTETLVLDSKGGVLMRDGEAYLDMEPVFFSEDDLRRIVACVNACSHFSTEELESLDKNDVALRVW